MKRIKLNTAGFKSKQQGFVLLTALVFMIVLTVILLSTVNISTSDEKIARNSRDKDIAFAAAEAALRDAEIYISGSYQFPYAPNNNPSFYPNQLATPEQSDFFSTGDTNYTYTCAIGGNGPGCRPASTNITQAPQIIGVNAQPRYLIDIVKYNGTACNNTTFLFRITVQSEGRSADTRVTLQEFYCPP
jgi:type IV pilus assembly protein PilX